MKSLMAIMMAAMGMAQQSAFMSDTTAALEAAQKIFAVEDRHPVIDSTSDAGMVFGPAKGEIEVKDIMFKYPSRPNQTILDGYSLKVCLGFFLRSLALAWAVIWEARRTSEVAHFLSLLELRARRGLFWGIDEVVWVSLRGVPPMAATTYSAHVRRYSRSATPHISSPGKRWCWLASPGAARVP